jgi:peptide/nickel transport system substrate-binding protein
MMLLPLGCGRGKSTATESSAPLEILVPTDAETLDPRFVTDAVGMRVSRLIHAGLFRLDPDTLAPTPYLAASYRWDDDRTLVVTLRDGVRFHSGAELGPSDVVATLHAFADPKVGARHARVVEAIDDVALVPGEPRAVRIHLGRAHATLLSDLELPILRAGEAFAPSGDGSTLDGLGPFTVTSFARGRIELVPATGAALPAPKRALRLLTVHDENARALRLLGGRADLALNGVSPSLLPALANEPALTITSRRGANLTYLLFRTDRGPFADPDLRQAVRWALDRAPVVTHMLDGRATLATGLLPPSLWAHGDRPGWDPDPARARRLVSAAGGRVHVTYLCGTDRLRVAIAKVFAQELGEVGFDVDVRPLELGTLLSRLSDGDFDLASLQIPEVTEPNVLRTFLHSTAVPPRGTNRARVSDAELDALLDQGDRERDPVVRKALYASVEERVLERAYWIPLWHEDQVAVVGPRAKTFVPSAEGRYLGLASLP